MEALADTYGGPYQYLRTKLKLEPEDEKKAQALNITLRNAFTQALVEMLPELDDVSYHHETRIPFYPLRRRDGNAIALYSPHHSLGVRQGCFNEGSPGRQLFLELMEWILQDGFKTANEPLLFTQPDELAHTGLDPVEFAKDQPHPLATASLGYVKGFARVATILAFFCMGVLRNMWI